MRIKNITTSERKFWDLGRGSWVYVKPGETVEAIRMEPHTSFEIKVEEKEKTKKNLRKGKEDDVQ